MKAFVTRQHVVLPAVARPNLWSVVVQAVLVLGAGIDAASDLSSLDAVTLTLSGIAVVSVFLRRHAPYVAFTMALPALFLAETDAAAAITLYGVASIGRSRPLLTVAAVLVFIGCLPIGNPTAPGSMWTASIIYGIVLALGPIALSNLVSTLTLLRHETAEITAERIDKRAEAVRAAVTADRAAIAREMHDVVSHQVSLIALHAGALQFTASERVSKDTARLIRQLSVTTLNELRAMLDVLHASEDAAPIPSRDPSEADLRELVASSGVATAARIDVPDSVSCDARRAVYRGLQEALTNVLKHAPGAAAQVDVQVESHEVVLTVENTTRSTTEPVLLNLPGSGRGIEGLTRRAEALGGHCSASQQGDRFVVRFAVPTLVRRGS
jgi:signal transduction histidine kinase